MFEKLMEEEPQPTAIELTEEMEVTKEKVAKRKKSLLVCLVLFAACVVLTIVLSKIFGVNKSEVDYVTFNPDMKEFKDACIEVTGLIEIIEEEQGETTYTYLVYEASNSPYNEGLIRVDEKVLNTAKVQAMISYTDSVINENATGNPPEPITFYGETRDVPEDLSLWISRQFVLSDFPNIRAGKVYLIGNLEKEWNTSLHPVAAVPYMLALILFVVVIVLTIRYRKARKRFEFFQESLESINNNNPII